MLISRLWVYSGLAKSSGSPVNRFLWLLWPRAAAHENKHQLLRHDYLSVGVSNKPAASCPHYSHCCSCLPQGRLRWRTGWGLPNPWHNFLIYFFRTFSNVFLAFCVYYCTIIRPSGCFMFTSTKNVCMLVSWTRCLYLNHYVARVCCKSARHWLTAVP